MELKNSTSGGASSSDSGADSGSDSGAASSGISVEEAVQATLSNIQENGIFVGDRWWIGQQNENMYAIDVIDSTYYQFSANTSVAL